MTNISYAPLKELLENNLHSDYYNLLVLKSSLNILAYKKIVPEDASDTLIIEMINNYKNQKELLEFVLLSTTSKVSFRDMIIPSLAEPIIEFI